MKRRSSPAAGGAPRAGGAPNAGDSSTAGAPVFHCPTVRSGAPGAAPAPDASIDPLWLAALAQTGTCCLLQI